MHLRSITLLALALSPSVTAQGVNCTLLGTHNQHGSYNDVWGYVAPNGKEYALLGATTGLVVIDCSVPSTPVERGYFPWATSTWRDMRTYGTYVYVVSEAAGGFMVVDMTNPDSPVSAGIVGAQYFSNAHNVCIDVGTGRLYAIGCNTGTPVFDLAANPTNPPFLGYAGGAGQSNYFHDLCVENGYGYGSMIYNGVLRIWDMSTFPPTALSDSPTPSSFTHNAWPNAAGTVVATTDERAGGVVKFFDITNKAAPIPRGQFTPNASSIPHNAFIIGNLCHVSWYTEGYQCIDISDPNNPVQVAAYDTWPGASGGFNGAWGCYPFQPSGNIYISDISTGLYIVRPQITDLAIAHTPLTDTQDEDGPYHVLATVTGSNPINSVTMSWRANGSGTFTTVPMQPTATPNQYAADIPGQDAVTGIEYHIDAADSAAPRRSPQSGEHTFLVGTVTRVWSDDFEQDLGWTHGLTANQDDWQRGMPNGRSGTSGGVGWSDPSTAVSGTSIWANDLGGTGFDGAYMNNTANWLQSPAIPTNGVQGLRLRYQRWLTLASGDSARVYVNGNLVWSQTTPLRDTSWQPVEHDISAIANSQTSLTIRVELQSNGSNVAGGWNLDDVELLTLTDAVPPSYYGTGTPGTANQVPALALAAPAQIGTTTQIFGSNMLANAAGFLVFNLSPANQSVLGIQLLVQPAGAIAALQFASPGGTASWPFAVPNNPAFDNIYVYSQLLVLDSGAANGQLAASQGMRFRSNLY